jgi:transcriptional regulator with XRE-family HTH domain
MVLYIIPNMSFKKVQIHTPLRQLRSRARLSEREASLRSHLSRSTLRQIETGSETSSAETLAAAAEPLGAQIAILSFPLDTPCESDCSSVATSLHILRDSTDKRPDSWKIHAMNWVDAFRRTLDARLLLLPPVAELSRPLTALLASIAFALSQEAEMDPPAWAARILWLPEPWFVAGVESLKASALLESPLAFRRNNIFVLGNFLERA